MIRNKTGFALIALVGAGLGVCRAASAQVIVQTFTVPNGTALPFSQNFNFNKFDSNDGTLNSVTLALNASVLMMNYTYGMMCVRSSTK